MSHSMTTPHIKPSFDILKENLKRFFYQQSLFNFLLVIGFNCRSLRSWINIVTFKYEFVNCNQSRNKYEFSFNKTLFIVPTNLCGTVQTCTTYITIITTISIFRYSFLLTTFLQATYFLENLFKRTSINNSVVKGCKIFVVYSLLWKIMDLAVCDITKTLQRATERNQALLHGKFPEKRKLQFKVNKFELVTVFYGSTRIIPYHGSNYPPVIYKKVKKLIMPIRVYCNLRKKREVKGFLKALTLNWVS